MAKVISKLNPGISYVDSCDVNPARFGKEISISSNQSKVPLSSCNDKFVIVSAASIIAKVNRDREIKNSGKHIMLAVVIHQTPRRLIL